MKPNKKVQTKIIVLEVITDLTNKYLEKKNVWWTVPTSKPQDSVWKIRQVKAITTQPVEKKGMVYK